jgi:hypothetical protein
LGTGFFCFAAAHTPQLPPALQCWQLLQLLQAVQLALPVHLLAQAIAGNRKRLKNKAAIISSLLSANTAVSYQWPHQQLKA